MNAPRHPASDPRDNRFSASRASRVTTLLAAIVGLSLVDLALTLGHMTGPGMFESNPLVVALAGGSGSPLAVVNFKALSLLIGVSLLFRTRRHLSAELAAWAMTAVLCGLTVQWALYTGELSAMDQTVLLALAESDEGWVRLR